MNVEKLMTREVHTCRPGDSLHQATSIMWDHDCGCVPVVEGEGRLVGMITDRDVCMAAFTTDRPLSQLRVQAAMSTGVRSCTTRSTIEEAEQIMKMHQIRRLPITDERGRLCGLLSLNDLALAVESDGRRGRDSGLDPEAIEETLAAICRHRASPGSTPARG